MLFKILVTLALLFPTVCNSQIGARQHITFTDNSIQKPVGLCTVDIDGDGDQDIVFGTQDDDKVMWSENLGEFNFKSPVLISDQVNYVAHVTTADLDNDGDEDVISVSSQDNKLAWYENTGNGTFGGQNVLSNSLNYVIWVVAADFDNDNDIDLLTCNFNSNDIQLFVNTGLGVFDPPILVLSNYNWPRRVISTDLNDDGFQDIIATSSGDSTVWLENLGGNAFGPKQVITPENWKSISSEDIDNDGNMDLILSSYSDSTYWYKNDGTGNFIDSVNLNTGMAVGDLHSIGDVDNDGDIDVVSSNLYDLYMNLNDGAGVFTTSSIMHSNSTMNSMKFADLDGDGNVELITCSWWHELVAFHKGMGDGTFGNQQNITGMADGPNRVYKFDLNGDGFIDVLSVSEDDDEVAWYKNYGNGRFGPQRIIDGYANETQNAHAGDINGDGLLDVVASATAIDQVAWYENLGNDEFGPKQIITNSISDVKGVSLGDFDGDLDLDIVASGYNSNLYWFENLDGLGTFGTATTINGTTGLLSKVVCDDIDNDGDIDLVTAGEWFENTGGGSFATGQSTHCAAGALNNFVLADYDNDGYKDCIWTSSSNGSVRITPNSPTGFNTNFVYVNMAMSFEAGLDVADVNNDGLLDFIVCDQLDEVAWIENLGGGTFSTLQTISNSPDDPRSVVVFDADNDGDIDIFCSSAADNSISWFQNQVTHLRQLKGRVFVDQNQNQMNDSTDFGCEMTSVSTAPLSDFGFSYPDGNYIVNLNDQFNTYILEPNLPPYWSISTDSLSYTVIIDSNYYFMDSLDFGLQIDTLVYEASNSLTGAFPRCNQIINYWLNIENTGTLPLEGIIHLELDDSISYVSGNVIPDSIVGQSVYWNLDSLTYFSDSLINVQIQMPDFNSIGDTLESSLTFIGIDSLGGNYSFVDTLNQMLVCAYDPNDKIVAPAGIGPQGMIPVTQEALDYTIRFQNTGNDTALVVRIEDQLSSYLDYQSIDFIASSHDVEIEVDQNGLANFLFEGIMLPDSNVNEVNSHGFIRFNIDILPGLPIGTVIENTAEIYFDSNPEVITNTTMNTLSCLETEVNINYSGENTLCLNSGAVVLNQETPTGGSYSVNGVQTNQFDPSVVGIGSHEIIYEYTDQYNCINSDTLQIDVVEVTVSINYTGADTVCINSEIITLSQETPVGGAYSINGAQTNQFNPLVVGIGEHNIYYSYLDSNGCQNTDSVSIYVDGCASIDQLKMGNLIIYPNPFSDKANVEFDFSSDKKHLIEVRNMLGQLILQKNKFEDSNLILEAKDFESGMYIISIIELDSTYRVYSNRFQVSN